MFWGLVLEPSKIYAQIVSTPFHISMAALDTRRADNEEEVTTLLVRQEDTEYVLGSLSMKNKIFNIPLGLDFDVGEEIEFYLHGDSPVHLTGFLASDEDVDAESEPEEIVKASDIKKAESAKRKLKDSSSSSPKKLKRIFDESLDDDTEEDDFTLDEGDLEEEDDSDESELTDSTSSSDLSDETSVPDETSPQKKDLKPQVQKQAGNIQSISKSQKKKQKENQLVKPNQQGNKLNQQQGNKLNQQQGNKQNQQQGNKQGNKQGNQQGNQNKTPQKNQQPNQNKTPQKIQQPNKTPQKTPQAKTPQMKTPQPGNKQQNAKSPQGNDVVPKENRKKILKGGIVVQDLVEGKGNVVSSSSKKVGVYYVGRLASNKKEFDSNLSGKPFSFNMGRGEVIRGWELGLEGMRVGGKRKITIPAKFGYGNSGAPPDIPPNSTLEFEVTVANTK